MNEEFDLIMQSSDSEGIEFGGVRTMADKEKPPYLLVPEFALLEPLPEHLRKRFTHALYLMHEQLDEHKTWEQIAAASAISPYHFHRQFTELFNETPGQYLSRLRLQVSVSLLMSSNPWSVTDIAQHSGFSSSQALGKALKRELGVSAKQVKTMASEFTPKESADFLNKLAHPGKGTTLESQLAEAMPTELIWYPKRGMKKVPIVDPDWESVVESYAEKSVRLMGATRIDQLEKSWQQIDTNIGDWQVEADKYDFVLPEGYYLCAEVYIVSDSGYSAALEALFDSVSDSKLEIDRSGFFVEMIRYIDFSELGGVTFSFQIPICE